jgi:flagellar biosynthesis protein FliP
MKKVILVCAAFILCLWCIPSAAYAQDVPGPGPDQEITPAMEIPFIDLSVRAPEDNQEVSLTVQLLLLLAVLSIAPSIIILLTSFLRIAIVFDFIKRALSLQQVPPTQVLMGIALFLTIFIMWPAITDIYENSLQPFAAGEIGLQEAYENFISPLRIFMYRQMREDTGNISLFMKMSNLPKPENLSDVPTHVLIPAFVLHEMTVAFKMGILLFIPFIVIDMVVASTLMSMGMIMLPPVMISLPFKIILFVLVDGWGLITQQLIASYG